MHGERATPQVGVHAGDVCDSPGQLEHPPPSTADGDRGMRRLDGFGQAVNSADPVVLSGEVERLGTEQSPDHLYRLF